MRRFRMPPEFAASSSRRFKNDDGPRINGDITQIDLPADKVSGLREAMRVLKGVEDISICRLTESDVVRHVLVQRIIKAYEEDEERRGPKKDRRERP